MWRGDSKYLLEMCCWAPSHSDGAYKLVLCIRGL